MPQSVPRLRLLILTGVLLVAIGLAWVHQRYPLPYIYRVSANRGPHYEDIHRFPASRIAASESPRELPVALDGHAAGVFEQYPDIDDFETFLEETATTAFLVVHQGHLVAERYLRGHDRLSLQNTFSVSKSFTSALVGLAVRDGVLAFDAPITRYLPELEGRDERFAAITVENLLDMRSGIRYSNKVSFPFVTADDALIYFHPDLEAVVLERTAVAEAPGGFLYNNYNPPLLGLILRRATGMSPSAYLEQELWQPLGAEQAAGWTVDSKGIERMESGFHAVGRDLARFGQLYLEDGQTGGRRVLPAPWVFNSTESREREVLEKYDGRAWDYRAGWWIVPRPQGRSDFCAIGHFGQFIYVSPQHEVVFVRNGPDRGEWGDFDWTALFYFAAERM